MFRSRCVIFNYSDPMEEDRGLTLCEGGWLGECLDSDKIPGEGREPKITGEQRSVKRFTQGDVDCVVCRQVVAQFPNARAKKMVGVSEDGQRCQIGESFVSPGFIEFSEEAISSKNVDDLNVQQVRSVQVPIPVAEP
jgi:hypothetical protein